MKKIQEYTRKLTRAMRVIGLMNVPYAIKGGEVYVLEVNPRASRTVPYVSKATGVPLPKIAVGLMWGRKLKDYAHLTGGHTTRPLSVSPNFIQFSPVPLTKFHPSEPAPRPETAPTR